MGEPPVSASRRGFLAGLLALPAVGLLEPLARFLPPSPPPQGDVFTVEMLDRMVAKLRAGWRPAPVYSHYLVVADPGQLEALGFKPEGQ